MAQGPKKQRTSPDSERRPIPWIWLASGSMLTVIGLLGLSWLLGDFLVTIPDDEKSTLSPIIVQLTAPPRPTATISLDPPTPTVAPTATTAATPDLSVAPSEIMVGFYASVVNTGGVGVTVRNGPSTSNLPVIVAAEGSFLLILEGPTAGGEYQWWRVRLADGTEGWVAGDFLVPSAAP